MRCLLSMTEPSMRVRLRQALDIISGEVHSDPYPQCNGEEKERRLQRSSGQHPKWGLQLSNSQYPRHSSYSSGSPSVVLHRGWKRRAEGRLSRVSSWISVTHLQRWQAQAVLFKVHRHFLAEYSPRLKDKCASGEGSSDDDPILLNDDDPGDFSCLLQLFYHK